MISYKRLRKILAERNISSYFLRNKCGDLNLDSKTIKRLFEDGNVSTSTLNTLCEILEVDLHDIIEYIPDKKE